MHKKQHIHVYFAVVLQVAAGTAWLSISHTHLTKLGLHTNHTVVFDTPMYAVYAVVFLVKIIYTTDTVHPVAPLTTPVRRRSRSYHTNAPHKVRLNKIRWMSFENSATYC